MLYTNGDDPVERGLLGNINFQVWGFFSKDRWGGSCHWNLLKMRDDDQSLELYSIYISLPNLFCNIYKFGHSDLWTIFLLHEGAHSTCTRHLFYPISKPLGFIPPSVVIVSPAQASTISPRCHHLDAGLGHLHPASLLDFSELQCGMPTRTHLALMHMPPWECTLNKEWWGPVSKYFYLFLAWVESSETHFVRLLTRCQGSLLE